MRRARALLACIALAGCASSSLSAEEQANRCDDFARAVAVARLPTTPSEQVARDVANSLDSQLARMATPALHEPAVQVHQDLHRIELLRRRGDTERADRTAEKAREHLAELAEACDLPEERFLTP